MAVFDLAFSGGGVKGVAQVGALEVLMRKHQVRRIVGSSAGSVMAVAVASGYGARQMVFMAQDQQRFSNVLVKPTEKDFPPDRRGPLRALFGAADGGQMGGRPLLNAFRGAAPLFTGPLADRFYQGAYLLEHGAVFKDDIFIELARSIPFLMGYNPDLTLGQFFAKSQRHLTLVATDTTDRELLALNHITAPDVPLAMALRMSVGIPFVWPEVVWKKEWGLYRGRRKEGNTVIDGGILANLPLRFLVDPSPEMQQVMGPPGPGEARPVGLFIDDRKPIPGRDAAPPGPTPPRPVQVLARLIETVGLATDEEAVRRYNAEQSVCRIGTHGVGYMEFELSKEQVEQLINAGRCAMTEYLQKLGV